MKQAKHLLFAFLLIITVSSQAQVGIGTATPAASAQLDVSSTTKGFLPPRMDSTARNTIVSPAAGLTIYNTTLQSVQVYNGTAWFSTVHFIGESYGAGIVFYVYDNGQHGLIAATADQNGGAPIIWVSDPFTYTMAKGNGLGAGIKNTASIIANQGYGDGTLYAARVCNEYVAFSRTITPPYYPYYTYYGDWYLPSIYELDLLFFNRNVVGGFANEYYWSSTEASFNNAWCQDFFNGKQLSIGKYVKYGIRAVRAF